MNPNDNLDRMLDQALSEYRDTEPLAGMEDRILRRMAAQPEPSLRRWAWVLAAVATAAVFVVAVWLGMHKHPHQQPVATNATQPAQQSTTHSPQIETPARRVHHRTGREAEVAREGVQPASPRRSVQAAQSKRSKPLPAQFPTPAPLTPEEHALIALARTHPDALLAPPEDKDQLSIAPIEIKPLAPESGATQGEQ